MPELAGAHASLPLCYPVSRSQNNAALYSQCFKESLCTDSSSFVIPITLPTPTQESRPSLLFSTCACVLSHFSHVQLFATPKECNPSGSSVHGDPPRQEYWSGLPCPPPGDLPNPGIKTHVSCIAGRFFTTEPPGKPSVSSSKIKLHLNSEKQSILSYAF